MPQIIIKPSNNEFIVNDNETILDAGIRNKLNLPHGCKDGDCGACKCKILSGNVKLATYRANILSDVEIHEGYTLLCRAYALNDIELEIPNLLNNLSIRVLPSKVSLIERISDTIILKLKLPSQLDFKFHAGQYIEIILKDKNRSYSIANAYGTNEIELHIKYYSGGVFSEFVLNELKIDSLLRFKGPLGNFGLRNTQNPAIFVCTGTGFAPIKALLEEMIYTNSNKQIYFYWGNQTISDFYMLEFLNNAKAKLNLSVKLCLSKEQQSGFYSGYVTDAILKDHDNLSSYEVYACGNRNMIESIYTIATSQLNLDRINFLSDVFTPAIVPVE